MKSIKKWGSVHPSYLAAVFVLFSTIAVIIVPIITRFFDLGQQPTSAQSVATSFSLGLLTAGYLYYLSLTSGFSTAWYAYAMTYNLAIIAIKFIISPAFLHNALGTVTRQYIFAGFIVMALYFLAFATLYYIYVRRFQAKHKNASGRLLSAAARLSLSVSFLLVAFAARTVIARVLSDTAAADYLKAIFSGSVIILPILLGIMIFTVVWAFEEAGQTAVKAKSLEPLREFLSVGILLIITYHLLWLLYTTNLFT